jgi:hypothetical protein
MLCDYRNKRNNKAINIAYPTVSIKMSKWCYYKGFRQNRVFVSYNNHIVDFKYLPEVVVFALWFSAVCKTKAMMKV